jgi:hypothetical protein
MTAGDSLCRVNPAKILNGRVPLVAAIVEKTGKSCPFLCLFHHTCPEMQLLGGQIPAFVVSPYNR